MGTPAVEMAPSWRLLIIAALSIKSGGTTTPTTVEPGQVGCFEPARELSGTELFGSLLIPLCRTMQQLPGDCLVLLRSSAIKSGHDETNHLTATTLGARTRCSLTATLACDCTGGVEICGRFTLLQTRKSINVHACTDCAAKWHAWHACEGYETPPHKHH